MRSTRWRLYAVFLIFAGSLLLALPTLRLGAASEALASHVGRMSLGLDLAGGTDITYLIRPQEPVVPEQERRQLANRIQDILTDRIDGLGVLASRITVQGPDHIRVQIPVQDLDKEQQVKAILSAQHFLSFHEVLDAAGSPASLETRSGARIVASAPGASRDSLYYLLKEQPEITGTHLQHAEAGRDELDRPVIHFTWNDEGAARFDEITRRLVGRRLALLLADKVESAPVVRGPIGRSGVIEGEFSAEEARHLVHVLGMGALPAMLEPIGEIRVGPTLGHDSARSAIRSAITGSILVFGFLISRYRVSGVIACFTLVANFLLQIVLLVAFGATLTLPGIAGFALTVGVSVDSNILIFERIREELAAGKPPARALHLGYDRASSAILDSHVTTITTGVVLYSLGSGPVRGFAVTLILGLLVNLFTAIWMTRVVQDALYSHPRTTVMSL